MPSITDLIKRTHTKADETYVDKYAEEIVQEVQSLATQMSPSTDDGEAELGSQESAAATPTPEVLNKAYFAHVPEKKGYRFGLGSIQHHQGEASTVTASSSRQLHLEK